MCNCITLGHFLAILDYFETIQYRFLMQLEIMISWHFSLQKCKMTRREIVTFLGFYCPEKMVVKLASRATLLEKFWRISLHVTDDANAKLYAT